VRSVSNRPATDCVANDAGFAAEQPFARGASVAVKGTDTSAERVWIGKAEAALAMSTTPSATELMRPKPPIDIAFIVASPQ
jgi:hypothetical protein